MQVICFHNPDEENGYLSNWYKSDFVIDGIRFSSVEQYMMYKKAVCFGDSETAKTIMQTENVAEIKALGREVKRYDENVWNGVRQIVVYEGLKAKFLQNEDLRKRLLGTGKAILAECAVNDKIWETGLSMKDPLRQDTSKWRGKNLLGYTLMMVRTIL